MTRLLIFALFALSHHSGAQDAAFGLMLNNLLDHSVDTISVHGLRKEIGSNDDLIILDARESGEYMVSHISGSVNVGYDDFSISYLDGVPYDAPLVVYCSVGYRSEKVGEKLKAAGYSDVRNLYGGIFDWVNKGQPVSDQAGHHTSKVHGYSKEWGIWLRKGDVVYE